MGALLSTVVTGCSNVEDGPAVSEAPSTNPVMTADKDTSASREETPEKPSLQQSENQPSHTGNGLLPGLDSTGDGPPSGQIALPAVTQTVTGAWVVSWAESDAADEIRLIASGGEAAGAVDVSLDWSSPVRPTRWVYLAMGQLTLTDENGQIVWAGRVEDENTIVQMRTDALAITHLRRP